MSEQGGLGGGGCAYIETPPVPCTTTTSPPLTETRPVKELYAVTAAILKRRQRVLSNLKFKY